MIDYGEQRLTLYIINYVVSDLSMSSGSRRRSYYSRSRKEKKKRSHTPKGKQVSSNKEPLKCTHTKLEWSLKKYRVNNIKFDQEKELKRCDHTDANKEDQVYWMPDPLDYLHSISSPPDLYSNKQRIQPNYHDHSKKDLHGPLKHFYNRKTYHGEQCPRLYINNY